MKIKESEGKIYFTGQTVRATEFKIDIDCITQFSDWPLLTEQFINYNVGKAPKSIISWMYRIIPILHEYLETSSIEKLPNNTDQWTSFIRSLYVITISSTKRKSSISTRVAEWNKNIRPFLNYLQSKDIIPCGVIIPSMKTVNQRTNNSSFNVSIIGESPAIKVDDKYLKKLLIPISLSRSDATYVDELYYELEKTRDYLFSCLKGYWQTIKNYHELGKNLLMNFDSKELESRISTKDFLMYFPRENEHPMPPIRRSIFLQNTKKSFVNFLYVVKTRIGFYNNKLIKDCSDLPTVPPGNTLAEQISLIECDTGVESFIESEKSISVWNKLNWFCGVLTQRDVSFIVALLMMDNPKFTFESLINCQVHDKNGKSYLEVNSERFSFSIKKDRAKSFKTENLSELSAEIINTLISMRQGVKTGLIDDKYKNFLLMCISSTSDVLTPQRPQKAHKWFSGSKDSKNHGIKNCFPSLYEYGLGDPGSLGHKKLRDTEAVLEFFRTGSVRSVSKKIGNSNKVALQHYIPEPLIVAFNTRQIRRFQNLLIIASVAKEDYLLEAVDFNSLDELNSFISDMVSLDVKGTNPLLSVINNSFKGESDLSNRGELIANISEKSLTYLYAYRLIAEKKNVPVEALNKPNMAVTPLSIITLSKHLSQVLAQHQDPTYRKTNVMAAETAKELSNQLNWGDLLLSMEKVS